MADWNLSYADRETLRPQLLPRIRQSLDKYFLYIVGGGGSPSADRIAWVKSNVVNIASLAEQLSHYVMSETGFIQGGTSISDDAISSRVEAVLVSFFMPT